MGKELFRHDYKKESDLCDLLSEHAQQKGWRVFPETGHDLLLVATEGVLTRHARPGDQIGVQAKLHANIEVVHQAMPKPWADKGPHYHAVLVPVSTPMFEAVARRCGIFVIEATRRVWSTEEKCWVRTRGMDEELGSLPASLRQYYDEMEWHPEVEVLVPAGVKSPKSVTPWKIASVKLCLDAIVRGFITKGDFTEAGVSMPFWRKEGWIEPTGERIGRSMKYRLVLENKPPHLKYPEITAALARDKAVDEGLSHRKRRVLGVPED